MQHRPAGFVPRSLILGEYQRVIHRNVGLYILSRLYYSHTNEDKISKKRRLKRLGKRLVCESLGQVRSSTRGRTSCLVMRLIYKDTTRGIYLRLNPSLSSKSKISIHMNMKMTISWTEKPLASVEEHTRATIKTLFQFLHAQARVTISASK